MRFRNGVDTYLNVLVAQNSLLSARLTLISLRLAQLQNSRSPSTRRWVAAGRNGRPRLRSSRALPLIGVQEAVHPASEDDPNPPASLGLQVVK